MSAVFPCSWSDQAGAEAVAPCCPRCEAPLALHQPDPQLPDRLLAVCEECTAWYVSDPSGILLAPIPAEDGPGPRRRKPLG
jgi:hypothetical protein